MTSAGPGYTLSEIEHHYGSHVHILRDPLTATLLAELCAMATVQPRINTLVAELYRHLIHCTIANELPRRQAEVKTRMFEHTPRGVWNGETVDKDTAVVTVGVARAGTYPSQICYDLLNNILDPTRVRQDHLIIGRTTDAEGRVTGAAISGSKVGGPVNDRVLIVPDPMGATGSSVLAALDFYQSMSPDRRLATRKVVALHLIVTPEYLLRLKKERPEVIVYALRVDRGLSEGEVLRTLPGERWAEERGLNEHHYIVPGGGGFGEIMNNAYV
jgi:uracil phosphoribosyltransferase